MEHEEKKTMLAVIFVQFTLFLFQVLWSLKEIGTFSFIFFGLQQSYFLC